MSALTILQQSNYDGFPKAAELIEIEGGHLLEASDRAVFNQLLQMAHDSGRLTEADAEWEVSLAGLRRAMSKHESNDRVRESLDRLMDTKVWVSHVSNRTGKSKTFKTHLLEFTDTDDRDSPGATVEFGIPKRLRLILARSSRWGRVRCEIPYAMSSKYAVALYEMICLRAKLDRCTERIDLQKFRRLVGVPPEAYERGDNLMRFVIRPALLEVNGLSDLGADIGLIRAHSRAPITAVALCWWKKTGDEFRAAIEERSRSKVGRKARLKAQTETKLLTSSTDAEEFITSRGQAA